MPQIARLAAATGLALALATPALAQSTPPTALNGQLNWSDVIADMTVVTQERTRSAAATATATGNAASGDTTGGLDARSRQEMSGSARAGARLEGGDVRYGSATAQAHANTLEAHTAHGDFNLSAAQFAKGGDVEARARAKIGNAYTLEAASAAVLNSATTSVHHGDQTVRLFQQATQSATAVTDVDACCTDETNAAAASAINAWSARSSTSTVMANYEQESWAGASQATTDIYQDRAWDVTAATSAVSNSASVANKWGYAQIHGRQTSHTDVRADTRVTLPDFAGSIDMSSHGVGNATLATNVGSDMMLDVTQMNTGGVEASAQMTGASRDYGDVTLSATAIGNEVYGQVCSQCGDAALTGAASQNNGGHIVATGRVTAGGAGYIVGSATAIGNAATFFTGRTTGN